MFNNLLVSTCLYQTLDINEIQQITEFLNDVYPSKTIMFRGFNEKLCPHLKENLLENNYKIIPYRQVYIQNKELRKNQKIAINILKYLVDSIATKVIKKNNF